MALSPQIAAFKSSGVYRLEFDKSQTVAIPAEQLRLIVGFSRKGPFNTPVFCPDAGFFRSVFGDISRADERKQSYFHRSCLTALERGPILALNLLRLNNATDGTGDYDEAYMFSTSSTDVNEGYTTDALYSGYYNQDKFFYPEEAATLTNIGATDSAPFNKLFNFVNLGQSKLTILVRKAAPDNVRGFNVTVQDWYGSANIPTFLSPESYISDFMVDIIVIGGNFGADATATYPYERFSSDPSFAQYFDKQSGLIRKLSPSDVTDTSVAQFLNLPQVNFLATYTGCLIPEFTDLQGNNLYIETLINADTASTGLFCAINTAMFDLDLVIDGVNGGIDLIGHELERLKPETVDFLSYKGTVVSDLNYPGEVTTIRTVSLSGCTISPESAGDIEFTVSKASNLALYNAIVGMTANVDVSDRTVGTYILTDAEDYAVPVIFKTTSSTQANFAVSSVKSDPAGTFSAADFPNASGTLKFINPIDMDFVTQEDGDNGIIVAGPASSLYEAAQDGIVTDGDKAEFGATYASSATVYLDFNAENKNYIYYDESSTTYEIAISDEDYPLPVFTVNAYENANFTSPITSDSDFGINQIGKFFFDTDEAAYTQGTFGVQTLKGSLNRTIDVLEDSTTPGSSLRANQVIVSAEYSSDVLVGNYLVQNIGNTTSGISSRLTRITEVVGISNYTAGVNALKITCTGEIFINTVGGQDTVELYYPVTEWFDYYELFTLDGFELGSYNMPDGTNDQQNNILNDTLSGTNLFYALIDKDNISYRYIVDTFGNGIEAGDKALLFTLAKDRQNAFLIANAPSVANFKKSTDPSFLNILGQFDTYYVSTGGNLSNNPTVRYSLPSITQGSSYGAFYFPFLVVRENGSNITVPPAAYVSNNYIDKYTSALPWSIVAGTRRGVVGGRGLVGVEYNLSKTDRDNVEPFGLNPIVFQPGSGLVIFGNKTAQQNVVSALSSAHVREVLIYIQDGLAAILKNYLFEFNTAQTRLEIKTLADNFMTTVQSENGVYAFRNIMDETNNTPDVIDRNVGILDTFIEPVKGMEILVTRTTILRTGQIQSGNA
jgi:hypothetical protein